MDRKYGCILRCCTDLIMSILMFLLLSLQYTGMYLHEVFGIVLILFMILHQVLNIRWYRALGEGVWHAPRILLMCTAFALLTDMCFLAVSGISMGREVIPRHLLPISHVTAVRIHLTAGYLGFLLMGFHLGLHVNRIGGRFRGRRRKSGRVWKIACRVVVTAVGIFGVYALWNEKFFSYILQKSHFVMFHFDQRAGFYMAELVAIWVLAATLGALAWKLTVQNFRPEGEKK